MFRRARAAEVLKKKELKLDITSNMIRPMSAAEVLKKKELKHFSDTGMNSISVCSRSPEEEGTETRELVTGPEDPVQPKS